MSDQDRCVGGVTLTDAFSEMQMSTGSDLSNLTLQSVEPFVLEPLSHSSEQIRLLKFTPEQQGDKISMVLTTWPFKDAIRQNTRDKSYGLKGLPNYNAISYTWGDNVESQAVFIDGKLLPVRQNCYYALCQVRRQHPNSFIWIDSICMDQSDLEEKKVQVQMMGEIYQWAEWVVACIGPQRDSSHILDEWAHLLEKVDFANHLWVEDIGRPHEGNPLTRLVVKHSGKAGVEPLCLAFQAFAARPYWSRVWIVQEILKSRDLQILCGEDTLSWREIIRLRDTLTGIAHTSKFSIQVDSVAIRNLSRALQPEITLSIQDTPLYFGRSQSKGVRDRVHGLNSIVPWEGSAPIPDYTISPFELLLDIQQRIPTDRIAEWMHMLNINAFNSELESAVIQRQAEFRLSDATPAISLAQSGQTIHLEHARLPFHPLEAAANGTLTARLKQDVVSSIEQQPDITKFLDMLNGFPLSASADSDSHSPRPKSLIVEETVIALLCDESRPGDVVVYCDQAFHSVDSNYYLVLRPRQRADFEIIGQGIALCRLDLRPPEPAEREIQRIRQGTHRSIDYIELGMTSEDLVVLVGQDVVDRDKYDLGGGFCDYSQA